MRVYGDIFFRFLIQWELWMGMAQVQLGELFYTCQFLAEVTQRWTWILLQMGDAVHRQFVVSANSNLAILFKDWHNQGSPVRVALWLNYLCLYQRVQFLL